MARKIDLDARGGDAIEVKSGGLVEIQDGGRAYVKSGGKHITASGGIRNLESGGLDQRAGVNQPASVTFTPTAGASNVCELAITVVDGAGVAVAGVFNLDIWLSDAATGAGLTGTEASGAVAAKAASGADLATLVSKKALRVQTLATGIYTLSITDSAKTAFYPCAQTPGVGATVVGAALLTANYG